MSEKALTSKERGELASIVRLRASVAKSDVDARAAELRAEVEAQLAAKYEANNEAWAEITAEAERAIARADAEVAAKCEELGIRPEFRPGLTVGWYDRGENAIAQRRTELRKVAQTKIEALAKGAKSEIARDELKARAEIAETAMTTDGARKWLDSIRTPTELMPTPTLAELEAAVPVDRLRRWK